MGRNSYSTPLPEVLEAAAVLLVRAGFERRYTSMKSEATYYGFPGRVGVIRVASHPTKAKREAEYGHPIVTKITFNGRHCDTPQHITIAEDAVHRTTAAAIGGYMIAAERLPP